MFKAFFCLFFVAALICKSYSQEGSIVKIDFNAPSLQSNLTKETGSKSVYVYLPPDYQTNRQHQYPVVYLLHGYTSDNKTWFNFGGDSLVQRSHLDSMIKNKIIKPFILVMPDGHNVFGGGFYTNSVVTGNWEDYIVEDLVNYIDQHFRTIPSREGRGIAGHSMGGYDALKIAMKHADRFSAVYASSACCLALTERDNDYSEKDIKAALEAKTMAEFNQLQFFSKAIIASAVAWSPNPAKPPFYADLPFGASETDPVIVSARNKMAANVPLWMVDQHVSALKTLKGISFDVGTQEASIRRYNILFSEALRNNGIQHEFQFFEGGHVDKLKQQLEKGVFPFFSGVFR